MRSAVAMKKRKFTKKRKLAKLRPRAAMKDTELAIILTKHITMANFLKHGNGKPTRKDVENATVQKKNLRKQAEKSSKMWKEIHDNNSGRLCFAASVVKSALAIVRSKKKTWSMPE